MPTAVERVFLASPTTGRNNPALAAPWLFTGEDNLRLVVINSQPGIVVTFDGRQLGDGATSPQAFTQSFAPTGDRVPNTFDFAFGDGFLLNCSLIVTSGSPLVGQTYCMLQVIRGLRGATLVLGCLLGGYITAMQHLAYPGSPIKSSTEDEPFVRAIVGTVPALGGQIAETVPAGARWELLTLRFVLATSAVAGARTPLLRIADPSNNTLANCVPPGTVPPGSAGDFSWGQNLPVLSNGLNGGQGAFPNLLTLPSGSRIRSNVSGMDVGDAITSVFYSVREWLEAA